MSSMVFFRVAGSRSAEPMASTGCMVSYVGSMSVENGLRWSRRQLSVGGPCPELDKDTEQALPGWFQSCLVPRLPSNVLDGNDRGRMAKAWGGTKSKSAPCELVRDFLVYTALRESPTGVLYQEQLKVVYDTTTLRSGRNQRFGFRRR